VSALTLIYKTIKLALKSNKSSELSWKATTNDNQRAQHHSRSYDVSAGACVWWTHPPCVVCRRVHH